MAHDTAQFCRRRTVRITRNEDDRLVYYAHLSGMTVSRYMRRRIFGGRPIVARTDDQAIRELRRLGGLLKHHFSMVRDTNQPEVCQEMNRTLRSIQTAIDRLGQSQNDPEED
ncbi:MAG: hypothetical protein K2O70_02310 [Desulfovibrionaceae bacterium]|nr:hypothetical protein [Desulfovibrionaceae bacterium]